MAQEGKRHPPNSGKPRTKGAEPRSKHAKPAQDKKVKGQSRTKGKDVLREQVLSMGGDNADLELLEGVKEDDEMELGDEAADPELSGDVSKFLRDLRSGSGPSTKVKPKEDVTVKESKKTKEKGAQEKKEKKEKKDKAKKPTEKPTEAQTEELATTAPPPIHTKTDGKLVFPPSAHWYSALPPLPPSKTVLPTLTSAQVASLSEKASSLLVTDAAAYHASSQFTGNSAADSHFLNTILSKGTLSDRLSALTLLVQASPLHNSKALETLKGMSERGRGKGGREEGLKAMRCVVDWWTGGGAPGRKLKYFRDQPLTHPSVTDSYLVMWHFEDWLKKFFFSILQILETYSLDPLPYVRTQALSFIATFLREKPEQEQNLLRLLVNKLGDTERAVCSRASYHLLQLLQSHPAMKGVIVREVRTLVFRPAASTSTAAQPDKKAGHIRFGDDESKKPKGKGKAAPEAKTNSMERWNSHAWYYAAVTLNQVVLTPSDHDREVARVLIDIYFEMFREILGGSVSFKHDDKPLEDAMETAEDAIDGKGKAKKGKGKEMRGAAGFAEVEDDNSRLISAVLTGVNRALPFAKFDLEGENATFNKHIDTLFLITHTSTFNISLQALMLILQVSSSLPASAPSTSTSEPTSLSASITGRFYRTLYSSLFDQRLSSSNKQAMYLNLLFKALKADTNMERVKAFVRRFVQILVAGVGGTGGVEFITGGLYLLGELFSTTPGLRATFTTNATSKAGTEGSYDPKKRDPQYAHASSSPLYELLPLLNHYHPAVSLHARQLLNAQPITATPDLSLNTVSHFLDRFVYKNPKKPKPKGASAMQPAASGTDGTGVKLLKGEVSNGVVPVNDEKWWKRRVEDVPVDEMFFHTYFTRRSEREKEMAAKVKKRKTHGEDDDSEDEADDESEAAGEELPEGSDEEAGDVAGEDEEEDSDKEEGEIWKAIKSSMPAELHDDDLSDASDDVPSGLDSDDGDAEEAESVDAEEDDEGNAGVPQGEDEDEDGFAEASDAEDLISLDGDAPLELIDYDGPDSEAEPNDEWEGFGGGDDKKRKRGGEDDRKSKKKKLRSLPTFASYEDYAKLIEDGPEDNI